MNLILQSGKTAIDLVLYVLLPVMVIMMAVMRLLEAKGVLTIAARVLSPIFAVVGIPGVGVFAALQVLLVSFAAPVATLSIMENGRINRRKIAATLAMVLTMSQANVVFPLVAVGLNLWITILTSIAGGLLASTLTYYVFARRIKAESTPGQSDEMTSMPNLTDEKHFLHMLLEGGRQGLEIVMKAIPILVLALFFVNALRAVGVVSLIESGLSPFFNRMGLPGIAVLPIATKYLAGGTAMMGVTLDLVREGVLTPLQLNRLAGFVINPLDIVGIVVLVSAGSRVASVVRPAIAGAIVGIIIRGVLHFVIF